MAKNKWNMVRKNDVGMKAIIKLYGNEKLDEWFQKQYDQYEWLIYKENEGERFIIIEDEFNPFRKKFPGDKTIENKLREGKAVMCDNVEVFIRYLSLLLRGNNSPCRVDIHQMVDGDEWHMHMSFPSRIKAINYIKTMPNVILWCFK